MFMNVESGKCPACCTSGRRMQSIAKIFVCPTCRAVFGDFGMVVSPQETIAEQQMA